MSLEIQLLETDSSGSFVYQKDVLEGWIEDHGLISFSLATDRGAVTPNSRNMTFDYSEPCVFSVAYDEAVGHMAKSIDGQMATARR